MATATTTAAPIHDLLGISPSFPGSCVMSTGAAAIPAAYVATAPTTPPSLWEKVPEIPFSLWEKARVRAGEVQRGG